MMYQQFISIALLVAVISSVQSINLPSSDIAKIAIPLPCPMLKCFGPCPNGNIMNERGCHTCECNPCKFGQPSHEHPCGQGQGTCSTIKGLCKMSTVDKAYCCPDERAGCCPTSPNPALVLCLPATCKNDNECPIGKKCCGPCSQCVDGILG